MWCELAALAFNVEAKGVLTGEGTWCQQRFCVANICLIRGLALTAAALMEFFSLKVVCAPLPLACCHQCVYPSFFQLPLFSVGSTGFWCSQDCGCGMVDWFCYTYHWSSCNYVVRRLPVGSQCRIAEDCIIKCILCSNSLYISDWCIRWYFHAYLQTSEQSCLHI